jgi:hypothetical protein
MEVHMRDLRPVKNSLPIFGAFGMVAGVVVGLLTHSIPISVGVGLAVGVGVGAIVQKRQRSQAPNR